MNKIFSTFIILLLSVISVSAKNLKPTSWESYGVTFLAPADIIIEDDSEESLTISNSDISINIQLLYGDGLKEKELIDDLKHITQEDNLKQTSEISPIELIHFFGAYITGTCETDQCLYSYLTTKDNACSFYISIICGKSDLSLAKEILRSFKLK